MIRGGSAALAVMLALLGAACAVAGVRGTYYAAIQALVPPAAAPGTTGATGAMGGGGHTTSH